MTVISQLPPAPTSGWTTPPNAPVIAPAAFLTTQASWLRRALLHTQDPMTVAIVVGSHNRSHERWLSLIAHTRSTVSIDVAAEVMSLYELHGRLVELIEHDTMFMLDPVVASAARIVRAEHLDERTEAVIAALSGARTG